MQTVEFNKIVPTRDYLQNIAKVIGKTQQLFIPPESHYWHVGLEITNDGFRTQKLVTDKVKGRLEVDLRNGIICSPRESWNLGGLSAAQLLSDLTLWLKDIGIQRKITKPDIANDDPTCEQESAVNILNMLSLANDVLTWAKRELNGLTSPVLLYPHHFDLALSWFPRNDQQYTMGFSTGDESIAEPYFYVTAYPEKMDFVSRILQSPAYWQKRGFSGAALKYNDIALAAKPKKTITAFFEQVLEGR